MIFDLTPYLKYPLYRITARSTDWSTTMIFDSSHKTIEIQLPTHVDAKDVEVFIEPVQSDIEPGTHRTVLKTKLRPRRGKQHGNDKRNNADK